MCTRLSTVSAVFVQLELILSSASVVTALYALVAGIFGMNLPYKWNEGYGYVFKWVSQTAVTHFFSISFRYQKSCMCLSL